MYHFVCVAKYRRLVINDEVDKVLFNQVEPVFITAVEEFFGYLAAWCLVGEFQCLGAEPHWTETTVTRLSGRRPRIAALGFRSSSRIIVAI